MGVKHFGDMEKGDLFVVPYVGDLCIKIERVIQVDYAIKRAWNAVRIRDGELMNYDSNTIVYERKNVISY